MKIGRATGGVSAVRKPGTANQFQRRELVAVPVLRRAHESWFRPRTPAVCVIRPCDGKTRSAFAPPWRPFQLGGAHVATPVGQGHPLARSEEHTSELQSLRHLV